MHDRMIPKRHLTPRAVLLTDAADLLMKYISDHPVPHGDCDDPGCPARFVADYARVTFEALLSLRTTIEVTDAVNNPEAMRGLANESPELASKLSQIVNLHLQEPGND